MIRRLIPFVLALAVYGGALLVMQPSPDGDEPHYALEALSLARDGDRDLSDDYADRETVVAVFGRPDLALHAYDFGAAEGLSSVHNVGLPLLLAPAAALDGSVQAMRLTMVLIAALAALLLMRLLERVPFGTPWLRWLAWAAVVLSAPMVSYASALFTEMPAVALTLAAALLLTNPRPRPATLAGAMAAAAALPWLNVRFLPITLALAAVAVWTTWRRTDRRRGLVAVALPLACGGAALMLAFAHWYGSPWPSAQYRFTEDTRTLSGAYRFGLGGFLSGDYGWLPRAPLHLLGVAAVGVVAARLGRTAWAGLAAVALYVAVIAVSGVGYPGGGFPGRMQLVLVPFAGVALLVLLAAAPRWRAPAMALGVVSFALTVQAVVAPTEARHPPEGSLAASYEQLWPDYGVEQELADWRLPAGATSGTTPPLPRDAYVLAVDVAAPDGVGGEAARIRLTAGGETLWNHPVTAREAQAEDGGRVLLLPFRLRATTEVEVDVRTAGATRVEGIQVATLAGASQAQVGGFPSLPLTLVWLAAIAAAGVAMARSVSRGTSGTTARG